MNRRLLVIPFLLIAISGFVMVSEQADADAIDLTVADVRYENGTLGVFVDQDVDGMAFTVKVNGVMQSTVAYGTSNLIVIPYTPSGGYDEIVLSNPDFSDVIVSYPDDVSMSEVYVSGHLSNPEAVYGYDVRVIVSGDLYLDDGAEMIVNGQLCVPEGSTLTIAPGASLYLEKQIATGTVMEVDGRVIIQGDGTDVGMLGIVSGIMDLHGSMDVHGDLIVLSGNVEYTEEEGGSDHSVINVFEDGRFILADPNGTIPLDRVSSVVEVNVSGYMMVGPGRNVILGALTVIDGGFIDAQSGSYSLEDGTFVTVLFQAGYDYLFDPMTAPGDEVYIRGTIIPLVSLITYNANLDQQTLNLLDSLDSTGLLIDDDLFMIVATAYDDTPTFGWFDHIPMENVWFSGRWYDLDGNDVTDMPVGSVDYARADVKYDVYNITILPNPGVKDVYIDGQKLDSDSDGNRHITLAAGNHHITCLMNDGYQGNPDYHVDGVLLEGSVFGTYGTPEDEHGIDYTISISGITLVGGESDHYIPVMSLEGDVFIAGMISLDGLPIPSDATMNVTFTVLEERTLFGKDVLVPVASEHTLYVTDGSGGYVWIRMDLGDICGDGVKVIGASIGMDGESYGLMSLNYTPGASA